LLREEPAGDVLPGHGARPRALQQRPAAAARSIAPQWLPAAASAPRSGGRHAPQWRPARPAAAPRRRPPAAAPRSGDPRAPNDKVERREERWRDKSGAQHLEISGTRGRPQPFGTGWLFPPVLKFDFWRQCVQSPGIKIYFFSLVPDFGINRCQFLSIGT
jgi:hypothetical protein